MKESLTVFILPLSLQEEFAPALCYGDLRRAWWRGRSLTVRLSLTLSKCRVPAGEDKLNEVVLGLANLSTARKFLSAS